MPPTSTLELPFTSSAHHCLFHKTHFTNNGVAVTPEFDFIVVGGGPSGCALATRLSQIGDAKFSVLLLEQGTSVDQHPELQNCVALSLQTRSLHRSSFDAAYPTVSKDQFSSRDLVINSGKVLGGSSCINWAIWTRGPKDDYDLWAQLVQNNAYSWAEMLPVFRQVEDFSFPAKSSTYDVAMHGTSGPINVRPISASPRAMQGRWSAIASKSFENTGLKPLGGGNSARDYPGACDINAGEMLGYGELQECIGEDGTRATANDYLKRAILFPGSKDTGANVDGVCLQPTASGGGGLQVWTGVRVKRVVFDCAGGSDNVTKSASGGRAPRAVGVETNVGFICVRKEVILTAGAVQSAHLLLLSGIGPQDQLTAHGVDVVKANNEVGRNMWEHPVVDIQFKVKNSMRGDTAEDLGSVKTAGRHLHEWATRRTGFMSGCPYEFVGFTNLLPEVSRRMSSEEKASLTPIARKSFLRESTPHMEQFLHYGHGLTAAPDPLTSSYIAISTVLLNPCSRGSVSLNPAKGIDVNSKDVDPPEICLNQLQETIDRDMMLVALEKSFNILGSAGWAEYLEQRTPPTHDELLDLMRERVTTLWHLGGTCSMQTVDSHGVVDSNLRVLGIHGLRVADTSVIPFPLAAHTQAVAYALGERAASFIANDYEQLTTPVPLSRL